MHVRPEIVSYSGSELLDLMGPVETQYCDVQVQPDPVQFLEPADLAVDFSQVPGFDAVRFEITDEGGRVEEERTVPRSEGQEMGTLWILQDVFDTDNDEGVYSVIVWLVDEGVRTEPCSTSFRLVGD